MVRIRSREPVDTPEGNDLLFLPLGGAGEIGMNLNLFGYRGRWLMVDCGVTFPDDSMQGIELIMPDPAWIAERADRLDGMVLTHAHEDHIGAVPYIWPKLRCPIYTTRFTAALLRRKLEDAGLAREARITILEEGARFKVGPFDIELMTLTHSIPEPSALVIRTPHGAVFHTGDWKIDPTPLIGGPVDEDALRRLGEEGVIAAIGDSTNVFRAGVAGSEKEVRDSLTELVGRYEKRVVIACFASNVARLETIAAVAEANGRQAGLVGRSMWRIYEAAQEAGYLRHIRPFLEPDEIAELPREKVLIAATGSQGEPRAALGRIAGRNHPDIALDPDDVVIFSSRIIPGNERAIGRLQDGLAKLGVEIVTEKDHFVHVSGHPARDELVQMYQWIKPKALVPVHGEMRHLFEHRKIARECQIRDSIVIGNGQMIRLAPGPLTIVDQVHASRLVLDGNELLPVDGSVVKERKRLLFNGSVVATVVVDRKGRLRADPRVTLQGLVEAGNAEDLYDAAVEAVEGAIERLPPGAREDDLSIEEAVVRALRKTVQQLRGKKPATAAHVVRV